jgi:D-alanyl-D-alanine carboxypeptidase
VFRPVSAAAAVVATAAAMVLISSPSAAAERPPLPLRPDGHGVAQPTPPDLVDRRLPTRDILPPPADGRFTSTVEPVPDDVLARSTWKPGCPVQPADLRYLTVAFRGFDGAAHTGELIVAARVADDVAAVFGELFAADFPIEEMRVVEAGELTAPPTGDGNNTTAFVCRPAVGSTRWSAHALGLAVDVNPFQNPYRRGDLVLPELASAYLDRNRERPGMIHDGGPVVAAFERIGWKWGGRWRSPVDLHHFSETGT